MNKVYTSTSFKGHNPVGTAAVIVAPDKSTALKLFVESLEAEGLYTNKPFNRVNAHLTEEHLTEIDLGEAQAIILANGNY